MLKSFKAEAQLISGNFGAFKSPKKTNQILDRFLPYEARTEIKSVKNLVGFLGDLKTPKFYSEIN